MQAHPCAHRAYAVALNGIALTPYRPVAPRPSNALRSRVHGPPLAYASPGLEVSRGGLPKDVVIQGLLGDQLLQPSIFFLQLTQLLGLLNFQATILLALAIVSLLGDPKLLAHQGYGLTFGQFDLSFAQFPNNLFRGKSFSRHLALLI